MLSVGKQGGFADDYSFLIQGLLDLYEASQVNTHTHTHTHTHTTRVHMYSVVSLLGPAVVGVGVESTAAAERAVLG